MAKAKQQPGQEGHGGHQEWGQLFSKSLDNFRVALGVSGLAGRLRTVCELCLFSWFARPTSTDHPKAQPDIPPMPTRLPPVIDISNPPTPTRSPPTIDVSMFDEFATKAGGVCWRTLEFRSLGWDLAPGGKMYEGPTSDPQRQQTPPVNIRR